MNPLTGRVFTVVNQDWGLRRGFKPCNTMTLVTALAGLTEGVIDPVELQMPDDRFSLNLTDALAFSNNTYFQRVGGRVGFESLMDYARRLGFGEQTGINYDNEYSGKLPAHKEGYAVMRMSSHGDDIEVTPIQLALLISSIANGGNILVPRLPSTPEEKVRFTPTVKRQVKIPKEMLNRVIPGMIGAVNYGSARRAFNPNITIAGKTGTCIGGSGSEAVWLRVRCKTSAGELRVDKIAHHGETHRERRAMGGGRAATAART